MISPVRAGAALGSLTFLHPTRDKTDWTLWLTKQPGPGQLCSKSTLRNHGSRHTAAIQMGIAIADETLVEGRAPDG